MDSIGNLLKNKFNSPVYSKHEHQAFGMRLAEELGDLKHKALYIKLARDEKRPLLETALEFVKSRQAKNKAKLFMWKLGELRSLNQESKSKNQEIKLKF